MDELSELKNWEYFKKEYAEYFLQYQIDENDPLDEIASDINDYHLGTINNDHIGWEIHIFLGKLLLEQENDATKEEMNNGSRLFWAIYYNRNIEFIKSIVDMGVYVDKKTHDPDSDEDVMITPFFLAVRERNIKVVELLLGKDIEVNFENNNITPLLYAFERLYHEHEDGNFEVKKEWEGIILLLLKHPDINANSGFETAYAEPDYDEIVGKTPLYLAIESDSFTIFDLLIKDPKTTIDLDSEFLPLKKIIEQYLDDMRYLTLFLQYHSDKINEDAFIHAVWYDNKKALKFLLENANWTLTPNPNTTYLQSMEITALLCNDANSGHVLPWEMMQNIFNFFPASKSETYTFDFNSSFFLKFHQNLFTDFLSIAAALCKTDMVEIILEHVLKKKCLFIRGLLSISHKLKDMKAFQDKEIREAKETLSKLLTPESYEKVQKAAIFLEKLYNVPIETQKTYEDREENFNAIMKMIEEVKKKLSHCGLAI